MNKPLPCIAIFLVLSNFIQAQVFTVAPGTSMSIKSGTVFSAGNLVLTPSADFTFTDNSLTKNTFVTHTANNPYIARVYNFSGNTAPFTGNIQINYNDGAELNGLTESALQLNINNNTSWTAFDAAINDDVNNYVLTTNLSNAILNELTLAEFGNALPLQWRYFNVVKQQMAAALQWSTFYEQNTKNFIVQTSTDNSYWKTIATLFAAGNSNTERTYNYVHTTPATGYNYYRIIETDINGKQNYSIARKILFAQPAFTIELLGNPVSNGLLSVKLNMPTPAAALPTLTIYAADGKLLYKQQATANVHTINVSRYAKGSYLLKANDITIQFLVQ